MAAVTSREYALFKSDQNQFSPHNITTGVLLYKSDRGARRKISRTPLKGTRNLFYGRVANSFHP